MRVLGIDPGTAITGYGLIDEDSQGQLSAIDYGVITTSKDLPAEARLKLVYEKVNEIILLHRPDAASVEKLFFQKNVSTAMTVGQSRGVVLLALAQASIPIREYNPMEVKLAVSGYGGADKKQVQEMVKVLLNLVVVPHPDDAADALAIAICHINSTRWERL